jgi:hypothetical protein
LKGSGVFEKNSQLLGTASGTLWPSLRITKQFLRLTKKPGPVNVL